MYVLSAFDDVTLPIYNRTGQFTTAPVASSVVQAVNGAFEENPDGRRFTFPYTQSWSAVVAEDDWSTMRSTVDDLRGLIGTRGKLYREALDDGDVQYADARLIRVMADQHPKANLHQSYTLDFLINSHWIGGEIGTWTSADGFWFDDGLFTPQTFNFPFIPPSPVSTTLVYYGNVPTTDVICTITAGAGVSTITNLTITVGDGRMYWSGSLPAGKSLVIDGGAWSVQNDGVDDYDGITLASNHGLETWFRLDPGSNGIGFAFSGGTGGSSNSTGQIKAKTLYA